VDINANTAAITTNTTDIDALEGKELLTVITDVDYTAEPYRVIVCTNVAPIDVTLNATPELNEVVHIKRANAEVNIIGTIDGLLDITLNVQYYSVHLVYNGTDWSII